VVSPVRPLFIRLARPLFTAFLALSALTGAASTVWAETNASVDPALAVEAAANLDALYAAPLDPIAEIERALLDQVNQDRAAHGLAPLLPDPEITAIARTRASAQIEAPSLTHYDATGKVAIQGMLAASNTTYSLAGENLARLRAEDAEAASQAEVALMNSPTHRKNILEPRFNRLAIGLVRAPDGRLIFAQIFRAV
jgi:uncharacterized protein YkwD